MTTNFVRFEDASSALSDTAIAVVAAGRKERFGSYLRRLIATKTFIVGAAIVGSWVIDALTWRWIAPHDPQSPDSAAVLHGPSRAHFFGTDDLGRDVFSRVLAGAQYALTVPVAATLLGLLAGTV